MSGIYGTVKPATIAENDVDIFYSYRATRESSIDGAEFTKLDASCLQPVTVKDGDVEVSDKHLPGLYNIKLPLDVFNKKGFYTLYIKPKEVKSKIMDIGTLVSYPDVRGVVLNANENPDFTAPNALVGYRIDYFTADGAREEKTRIITSSYRCDVMSQVVLGDATHRYRYGDGSLIFCTVTPSLAPSFKANSAPDIGKQGQEISLINTKFNPVVMEVELVEHDADTISTMLEGEQVRDLDHGLITYFDENRAIYRQYEYKALKDSLGNPAYDIKTKKERPDLNQDINSILGV